MHTDLLTLTQLLSPSFPVGAFAYSHGIEAAVAAGRITDAASLQDWLTDLVAFGSLRADAVLLRLAFEADDADLAALDAEARALAASSERLQETDLQGAAFGETVAAVWGLDPPRLCYPLAIGHAARLMGLDVSAVGAVFLHASVSNLTAAAMRLVPLGQVDGQKVMAALQPLCATTADSLRDATPRDLHSASWMSDIMAMRHETQYSRVFRS